MSSTQARSGEGEISSSGNGLRKLLLRATVISALPMLAALAYIIGLREPAIQAASITALAEVAASNKAVNLRDYAADIVDRTSYLAANLPADTQPGPLDAIKLGFPDARSVLVVPLDDMGTVNLAPGQYGIESHIGVDLVRRAFAGESPQPEAVLRTQPGYTLIARPYGRPLAGVVLVAMDNRRLAALMAPVKEGRYQLVQSLPDAPAQTVAGSLGNFSKQAQAAVDGTPWQIEFAPSPDWIGDMVPGWVELAIAGGVALLGLLAGAIVFLQGAPKLLRTEVDRILEAADLRTALKLNIPELVPLAKMVRQLSLLSRRQLVNHARRDAQQEAEPEEKPADSPSTVERTDQEPELSVDDPDEDDEVATEPSRDGIPDHIFMHSCIRGDTSTELTDEMVEKIGRALAVMTGERGIQTLVVAHDSRPSSKSIRTTLVKSLLAGGRDIIDIGETPTPLMYFATHETAADSGIMITGSHSAQSINGLKIVFNRRVLSGSDIQALLELVRSGKQTQGTGHAAKHDIEAEYVDRVAMDIALALPLKIVVDNDFGSAAVIAPTLFSGLDCEVVSINNPDQGPRPEDWNIASALAALGERVKAEGADLGVLFDSDGDRLHAVTDTGEAVGTDQLLMLLARDVLERNPGADIVYDVRFSRSFAPFITRTGGRALIAKSGHASIGDKMRESGAVLAGDFSGHIFIEERWYGFDDGLYAVARLLEILAAASGSFSELIAALPNAVSTPELTVTMDRGERRKLMRKLIDNADFPGARVTTIDGLRVDYADSWGLIRDDVGDGVLSMRFEGHDEASLKRIQGLLRKAVLTAKPDLELPF